VPGLRGEPLAEPLPLLVGGLGREHRQQLRLLLLDVVLQLAGQRGQLAVVAGLARPAGEQLGQQGLGVVVLGRAVMHLLGLVRLQLCDARVDERLLRGRVRSEQAGDPPEQGMRVGALLLGLLEQLLDLAVLRLDQRYDVRHGGSLR
jgi:hypothetical protein